MCSAPHTPPPTTHRDPAEPPAEADPVATEPDFNNAEVNAMAINDVNVADVMDMINAEAPAEQG
jgi:hypothetical protein